MSLTFCRVVLVGVQFPGNVGSTARAMRNFGLEELVLVRPECDHLEPAAKKLSTQGDEILVRARVADALPEAIADCVRVVGTTARVGGLYRKQTVGTPEVILPDTVRSLRDGHKAALVFGPERIGLTNEEATLCHALIQIPASDAYPVLNLAQAVTICLYELHRAFLNNAELEGIPDSEAEAGTLSRMRQCVDTPAAWGEQDQMFAHLQKTLERIHFLHGDKAGPLMHALRHLLGKANLTRMEVRLLRGIARQIDWALDHRVL